MTETSQAFKSCVQCRTNNPAAAKFCSECGERFAVVSVSRVNSATGLNASAITSCDPSAALERLISSLDNEEATSRLQTAIAANRARLKTLGVPLPKATNPLLVSLMESLRALPTNEISARIAIVTALGRMGDPAVLPPLLLVTGAQSRDVRKATAVALGCIRHPLSAYLLLPMLHDGSSRVRQTSFQR
ncbi:MAG: HEAT repeat domain-containing protein [Planctomycetaceae bacterium]